MYNLSRELANFPLSLEEVGDNYEMMLAFPSRVDLVPNEYSPFNPNNSYYFAEDQVVPNLLSKFNSINDDWVAYALDPNVRGETTSEYGVDAVRDNFERKFPEGLWRVQVRQDPYLLLSLQGKDAAIGSETFPVQERQ